MPPRFRPTATCLLTVVTLAGCATSVPYTQGGIGFVLPPIDTTRVPVDTADRTPGPDAGSGPGPGPSSPPSAHPAAGGGASNSGSADSTGFRGKVVGVYNGQEVPLVGAFVRTSDAQEAVTASDGGFVLASLPEDGALVASHPGYTASAVVGLTGEAPVTLHLAATSGTSEFPPPSIHTRMKAVGRVLTPGGAGLAGVVVVLEDQEGTVSAPAVTDETGGFELTVFAPNRQVLNGTLLAVSTPESGEQGWMGVATGVTLSATAPDLDLDPSKPGNNPLTLTPTTHAVRLAVNAGAAGASASMAIELVGPNGASLGLPLIGGVAQVAVLPGAHYAARSVAQDVLLGTRSEFRQEPLALDPGAETVVEATLLAPPILLDDAGLGAGQLFRWQAVAGASAYQATIAGVDGASFVWEGFTQATELRFMRETPLPSGTYSFNLTAWDAPGMAPRQVAAVGPARLRVLPLAGSYRKSSRLTRRSR